MNFINKNLFFYKYIKSYVILLNFIIYILLSKIVTYISNV